MRRENFWGWVVLGVSLLVAVYLTAGAAMTVRPLGPVELARLEARLERAGRAQLTAGIRINREGEEVVILQAVLADGQRVRIEAPAEFGEEKSTGETPVPPGKGNAAAD